MGVLPYYHIARHRAPQATSTHPLVAFLRPGVQSPTRARWRHSRRGAHPTARLNAATSI